MRLKGFMKTGALVALLSASAEPALSQEFTLDSKKLYHAFMDAPDPPDG